MKMFLASTCLLLLLPGDSLANQSRKELVDAEIAKLQGTWQIISYVENGVELTPEQLKKLPLVTFKGRDYTWSVGGTPGTITRIDPTAKPKVIFYQVTGGPAKGQTNSSIYELEGDTFKDCFAPPRAARPKEFVSKRGTGHTLIIYERLKLDSVDN